MASGTDSLAEKVKAFKQLESPQVSDDEFDEEELAWRRRSRAFFILENEDGTKPGKHNGQQQPKVQKPGPDGKSPKTKKRVSSAPTPVQATASKTTIKDTPADVAARRRTRVGRLVQGQGTAAASSLSLGETTVIPDTVQPAKRLLHRGDSTPAAVTKRVIVDDTPSRTLAPPKRRKKDPTPSMRPESDQIFKDLSFYYVPDNDIAPARRIRISKAKEYGASWTRFPQFATHMIVDKNIRYDEIQKLVAEARSSVVVVNENYPIDCVQFKAVLDPRQKKYQLVGQPAEDPLPTNTSSGLRAPPPCSSSSQHSPVSSFPPLKPPERNPKKWDYMPLVATPERSSGESPQASRITSTPVQIGSEAMTATNINSTREPPPPSGEAREAPKDELQDYISMMQEFRDVPLDVDDDEYPGSATASGVDANAGVDSGSEEERSQSWQVKTNTRSGRKELDFTDRFACNRAGHKDANADNPNARTMEVLQKMANYYDRVDDHWRTTAYRKAIGTLKRQDVKISTEEEAFKLPNVGRRLAQKIEEIVTTDKLQRLEYAQMDPKSQVLQLFLGIYGVGNAQAQQWISQGYYTLHDVRENVKLTTNQLVGIDHYHDLNTRIPRKEVEALGTVVKKAGFAIDPEVELIIGGSYRRGAESLGDIDFIVTKKNTESALDLRPFLDRLVQKLEADKFLVARLASGRPGSDGSKWHGCCVLPKTKGINDDDKYRPIWRRIDFLVVPETEMGAALIYFTGNDIFNRSMRLLASKKGMRLNQRGLYKDVMRGPARVKVTEGELLEGRDERRIFEILGVQWREPHERWC
jgi:DNA polymerase IV